MEQRVGGNRGGRGPSRGRRGGSGNNRARGGRGANGGGRQQQSSGISSLQNVDSSINEAKFPENPPAPRADTGGSNPNARRRGGRGREERENDPVQGEEHVASRNARRSNRRRRGTSRQDRGNGEQTSVPQIDYAGQWKRAYELTKTLVQSEQIDEAITYLELIISFLRNVAGTTLSVDISFSPPPPPLSDDTLNTVNVSSRDGRGSRSNPNFHQTIFEFLEELGGNDDDQEGYDVLSTSRFDARANTNTRSGASNVVPGPSGAPNPNPNGYSPRKIFFILIELLTYLGELYAMKAGTIRRQHGVTWSQGAEYFTSSCGFLSQALELTSSHIFHTFQIHETANSDYDELVEMAIALTIVTEHCEAKLKEFKEKAELRQRRVLERLNPQLRERNNIRDNVFGPERWTNNPNPRQDYAERRRLLEEEARDLEVALHHLGVADNRYTEVHIQAEALANHNAL